MAAHTLLADVGDSGRRITAIVDSAKDYTNMDRSPEQDVDLARGISSTLAVLAPRLSGITVHRDFDPALPTVVGFPGELNQVWTTLIENAADAMDGDGDLWVRTAREGAYALIEVIDSGPGIPPAAQDRVFDPFFTTKDIGKGAGLGLHLARRVVTLRHRGTLSVRSRPGETRFLARFPLTEERS